jgi:hypothetical protein
MPGLLIESHFLPCLEYFCALSQHDSIFLEHHENYVKQSYRNRCYILTTHGVDRLTIPLTNKHGKVPISEVMIDYSFRWQTNFWRTIQSAYAASPFFEHYGDELKQGIFSGEKYLFDLNHRLLSMCLTWLRWNKQVSVTEIYETETTMADLRNVISAKTDFTRRNIILPQPYQQVFGKAFVPNLSVLDLMFCVGPEAGHKILASTREN